MQLTRDVSCRSMTSTLIFLILVTGTGTALKLIVELVPCVQEGKGLSLIFYKKMSLVSMKGNSFALGLNHSVKTALIL